MQWTKFSNRIFKIFFWGNLVAATLTLPVLGLCQQHIYGTGEGRDFFFYATKDYWQPIGVLFGLFLVTQFFAYSVDIFRLIIRNIKTHKIENNELICFGVAFLSGLIWISIVIKLRWNGHCDILIGPADTGITIALIVASAINFWKLKIIEQKSK